MDDDVGVSGLGEGFWSVIGLGNVAVDGGLEIDDYLEDAALQPLPGQLGKEPLMCRGARPLVRSASTGIRYYFFEFRRFSIVSTSDCTLRS